MFSIFSTVTSSSWSGLDCSVIVTSEGVRLRVLTVRDRLEPDSLGVSQTPPVSWLNLSVRAGLSSRLVSTTWSARRLNMPAWSSPATR